MQKVDINVSAPDWLGLWPAHGGSRFALDSQQPTLEYHYVGHFHVNPNGRRS
jgi:hypothetical protein